MKSPLRARWRSLRPAVDAAQLDLLDAASVGPRRLRSDFPVPRGPSYPWRLASGWRYRWLALWSGPGGASSCARGRKESPAEASAAEGGVVMKTLGTLFVTALAVAGLVVACSVPVDPSPPAKDPGVRDGAAGAGGAIAGLTNNELAFFAARNNAFLAQQTVPQALAP